MLDVRRAYFYAEEKRNTFVEFQTTSLRGKAAQSVVRDSASYSVIKRRAEERTRQLWSTVSRCCFRNQSGSVAGAVHGDDDFVAGPREEVVRMGALLKKRWGTRVQFVGARPR